MKVVHVTPALEPTYERFVAAQDTAMVYYSLRYRDLLVRLLGCRPRYLLVLRGETAEGVLPLMEREGPYGRVVNSLPYYGSNGGVLATSRAASRALWDAYSRIVGEAGVAAATVIGHPLRRDAPPAALVHLTDERVGQLTRLGEARDAETALWERIDGSTRRNVKKAKRADIQVEVDNSALSFLYETHHDNITAIGGVAKERRFFDLLPECFAVDQDYRVYIARVGQAPVAALLLFYYGKVVEYFTPATVHDARPLQPSALLLWRAMTDAAAAGYRLWNWGGTWLNQQGVYRFKRKWGAEDHRYRYCTTLNDPALRRMAQDDLLRGYPGFFTLPFSALQSAA